MQGCSEIHNNNNYYYYYYYYSTNYGLDGPESNPSGDETFRLSRPALEPTSLLQIGYRVFPGGEVRPGRVADHSPPSRAAVMEEYSYTSTHPLGHTGSVTGSLYFTYALLLLLIMLSPFIAPVSNLSISAEFSQILRYISR